MRIIVILKSKRYYVCSESVDENLGSVTYRMPMGGRVAIPKENIDSIEIYTDDETEFSLRPRLRELENSENYEKA